jgi:S-adenosyl methyltransferase
MVYADTDPVVVAHARALMAADDAVAIEADLRYPASALAHPMARKLIRDSEPTTVVLALVLHFFDADTARHSAAAVTAWLPQGSYAVVSVGAAERELGEALAREYTAAKAYNHTPQQVEEFFAGMNLVSPGLVDAVDWNPRASARPSAPSGVRVLAGIWHKTSENASARSSSRTNGGATYP